MHTWLLSNPITDDTKFCLFTYTLEFFASEILLRLNPLQIPSTSSTMLLLFPHSSVELQLTETSSTMLDLIAAHSLSVTAFPIPTSVLRSLLTIRQWYTLFLPRSSAGYSMHRHKCGCMSLSSGPSVTSTPFFFFPAWWNHTHLYCHPISTLLSSILLHSRDLSFLPWTTAVWIRWFKQCTLTLIPIHIYNFQFLYPLSPWQDFIQWRGKGEISPLYRLQTIP